MLAMIVMTGAMAQITDGGTYVQVSTDDDGVSYVTVGKTMPFFAWPDNAYSPGYNPETGAGLNTESSWAWTLPAGFSQTGNDANYVEITVSGMPGDYTINVKESAPSSFGGCEDGTGSDMTIRVVAAPVIESLPYFDGIADPLLACETLTINPNIEVTGYPNFQVSVSLDYREVDVNGNPAVGATGSWTSILNESLVTASIANSYTSGTHTFVFDADRALAVVNGSRTEYRYTIHGINDNISRRSDYLSTATLYGATSTQNFIVSKAPTTGPIFHIPNNFGIL